MFSCVVDITPRPAPRIRFNKKGGRYYETWYNEYRNEIKSQVNKYVLGNLFKGYLKIDLLFYKNRPVTADDYGDCDNLAKGVLDALNGILYEDDSQVKILYVDKNTADENKIVICCSTIE